MKAKATRASAKDPYFSFTYRTSQFPQWVFNPGDRYIFEYVNGVKITLKASRNGDTLYTGQIGYHHLDLPDLGFPVIHEVIAIYKELKQLEA